MRPEALRAIGKRPKPFGRQKAIRKGGGKHSPAHNVAVNLLVDAPDMSFSDLLEAVDGADDLRDQVTGVSVPAAEVRAALKALIPPEFLDRGKRIRVYHATDRATAELLTRRGFIPETKPHARNPEGEYAPGRGHDPGLYVGASPEQVEGYGRVTLEITLPTEMLRVPTELTQRGNTDPIKALAEHDGAMILGRLPRSAFRIVDR